MENKMKRDPRKKKKMQLMVGIAGIIGFCILLFSVLTGYAAAFDDPVRNFFYDLRCEWLTPIVKAITYLGNWQSIVILCLVLLILPPTRIPYGVPVASGAIFVTILNKIIKNIVQRPRPDDILHLVQEGGFSFSSGHSITSMFVYGMLIYLIRKNVQNRILANILTVLLCIPLIGVGISRIYLGVHYPTDVLAGWCLGITVIILMVELLHRFRRTEADSVQCQASDDGDRL